MDFFFVLNSEAIDFFLIQLDELNDMISESGRGLFGIHIYLLKVV